jgi:hypothetical protein
MDEKSPSNCARHIEAVSREARKLHKGHGVYGTEARPGVARIAEKEKVILRHITCTLRLIKSSRRGGAGRRARRGRGAAPQLPLRRRQREVMRGLGYHQRPRKLGAQKAKMERDWPLLNFEQLKGSVVRWTGKIRGFQKWYLIAVYWDSEGPERPYVVLLDPPLRQRTGGKFEEIHQLLRGVPIPKGREIRPKGREIRSCKRRDV